jgi:hypothetical protein
MPSKRSISRFSTPLDVELPLPLPPASALDIDLSADDAAQGMVPGPGALFQPTLSQLAADPSQSRTRWSGLSRSGYRGATTGNGMRDGSASLGQRDNAKR